jgi:hypothetical protein
MNLTHGPRHNSTTRSFNGCWTCRLRRKKCDEIHPECGACAALYITCHYDQNKPEWMDGDVRQEDMAERLKREVKEKAHRRRGSVRFPSLPTTSQFPKLPLAHRSCYPNDYKGTRPLLCVIYSGLPQTFTIMESSRAPRYPIPGYSVGLIARLLTKTPEKV